MYISMVFSCRVTYYNWLVSYIILWMHVSDIKGVPFIIITRDASSKITGIIGIQKQLAK